jgi:hypothetical protein
MLESFTLQNSVLLIKEKENKSKGIQKMLRVNALSGTTVPGLCIAAA